MDDLEDIEQLNTLRALRTSRILKDRSNPMEQYNSQEFRQRYRFNKETVIEMLPLLDCLRKTETRGSPLPVLLQFLVALRYFGSGSMQVVCGDLHNIHQTTVSRIIKKVSNTICQQIHHYIKFPENTLELKSKFYRFAHFPGVIGAVDGTHIPIKNPNLQNGEIFRNRKGYYSLNVQVIGGPNNEIFDIVCRWPGSAHDSRIFRDSAVSLRFEDAELQGILLGDSGYPQTRFLFTPVINERRLADERYNLSHKCTRQIIERTFGIWKRRFLCLYHEMATKLDTTRKIIVATAILHNIAMSCNDTDQGFAQFNDNQPEHVAYSDAQRAVNIFKYNFISRYFGRGRQEEALAE